MQAAPKVLLESMDISVLKATEIGDRVALSFDADV